MSRQQRGIPVKTALCLATLAAGLTLVSAATASVGWTPQDIKTAVRGLGYPKPHPERLVCAGIGSDTFRCVATYRHHRRNRFVIKSAAGPWLCAGKTIAACTALRRGFVTDRQLAERYDGHLVSAAQFASRGYMTIHYNDPQPFVSSPCAPSSVPSTWTFCYKLDVGSVSVAVTLKHAKSGYVATVAAALSQ